MNPRTTSLALTLALALSLIGCQTQTKDTNTDTSTDSADTSSDCNPAWEDAGPSNRTSGQEEQESRMYPGADCLQCHDQGGIAVESEGGGNENLFSVAGTLFVDVDGTQPLQGATVTVTDADGQAVTMTTNAAGSFYTERPVSFPATASVEQDGVITEMSVPLERGGCNGCHVCGGSEGTSGKIHP